jgi:hypothetical protein
MASGGDRPAFEPQEGTHGAVPVSHHSVEGEARDPMTDEEMQQFMTRINFLEDEMRSTGAFVFGGALHDPDTATVMRVSGGDVLTTDRPFAESKEHLGGF